MILSDIVLRKKLNNIRERRIQYTRVRIRLKGGNEFFRRKLKIERRGKK